MQMVNIQLHGNVFSDIQTQYRLAVESVAEAMHAINIISQKKFYRQLLENDKLGIKYDILINKRKCLYAKEPNINDPESLITNEILADIHNLESIDIVPVMQGADSDVGIIIAGIVLIIVGVILYNPALIGWGVSAMTTIGAAVVIAGIGLVAAGVINLLSSPPRLEDFQGGNRKGSYLFDGPQNTSGEGGPVPVLYGRLLVGSQTILANQSISNVTAAEEITV